ncbi:MAG: glycoside hydrolase family 5 protein [Chloroflexi bacterium]|nr:glycoside hydrolase family 5 protein [Chloroflexota bacterium]
MKKFKLIPLLVLASLLTSACKQAPQLPTSTLTAASTNTLRPEPTKTSSSNPSPPDLPRLQVVGNKIVNENGEIVVLRGIGTADIIGLSRWSTDIPWGEELFRTIHDWGATVVRLPVSPVFFFEDEQKGLEALDQAIEWAAKYEMYVIITFHAFGFPPTGFLINPSDLGMASDVDGIRFWQTVSERYAGNDVVAFYEIFNEANSHPWDGLTHLEDWIIWKDFSELVIDLIRVNDPETIIIVGGLKFSSDLTYILQAPIQRNNVAYAHHENPGIKDWDKAFGGVVEQYPVLITDFTFGIDITGEQSWLNESNYQGEEPYRYAIMNYLEERGLSWIAVVFSSLWVPELVQNQLFEPSEVGQFYQEQLLSHGWEITIGEMIAGDKNIFNGAVGFWESLDPSDGSSRTLRISSVAGDQYSVNFVDDEVPLCGVNTYGAPLTGAEARGEGQAFYQKLDVGPLYLECSNNNGWVGGVHYDTFLYDPYSDSLVDLQGTIWTRSAEQDANENEFGGAVGDWESTDNDGSYQTLTIQQISDVLFSIELADSGASSCGTDDTGGPLYAARLEGSGNADLNFLFLQVLELTCMGDPEWSLDPLSLTLTYDLITDILSDSWGVVWTRIR